jgi:WD40 repeat protein
MVRAVALGKVGERATVLSGGDDGTLRLWDAADGSQLGEPLLSRSGWVLAVAFGSIGERAVLACADGATVRLWDAADRRQLAEPLTANDSSVNDVALGRFGERELVASAGWRTARVWDAWTRTEVQVIDMLGHGRALALAAPFRLVMLSGGAICCFTPAARTQ